MERIQSAIAKARAARRSASGTAPDRPPAFLSRPATSDASRIAEAWEALPLVAPGAGQLARHHIVATRGGRETAAFDVMRTKLLHQMRAQGWRRVAITSPGAGCGKSTIALNLAFSLARQPELRVLLAEIDLRRPSLARILGLREKHDFAEVLQGSARFDDNAVRIGTNLAIATNRAPFRNPAELLQGTSVPAVLSEIESRYAPDVVIFDMPPLLVSDETMAFAGQVHCALLIAAAESTSASEVDVCEQELAGQTNVLGVVLNKCRFMGPDHGYGYYG